jgi:hypothetical protein
MIEMSTSPTTPATNWTDSVVDEVEGLIREWGVRLDLQHWTIHVDFDLEEHLGTCVAQPEYMTATLSFNARRMRNETTTRRALEELVLHELVHARLWAIANMFSGLDANGERMLEFLEEEAVTQMTGALLRAKYNER